MTYVIALPCVDVKDRACVEECPVDCIYEGERTLYIHPDECVDCGACEPVCPTEAIFYEDDVPEEWEDYTRANIDFFELKGLGSPGGAQRTGALDYDDPHDRRPCPRRTRSGKRPTATEPTGRGWRRPRPVREESRARDHQRDT